MTDELENVRRDGYAYPMGEVSYDRDPRIGMAVIYGETVDQDVNRRVSVILREMR